MCSRGQALKTGGFTAYKTLMRFGNTRFVMQSMATLNDVIDYARFYGGSGEPPVFCHEHFDLDNKIFVATDDFKLAQKLTSHTVEDTAAFESGISAAIDIIQPDYICWYGKVFDFMEKYYDIHRIVRMQTRTELLRMYQKKCDADSGLYLPLFSA